MFEDSESRLSKLFAEYRAALPDPDPSPAFTPALWQKIDARRSYAFTLKRFSEMLITAAAAASLIMGVWMTWPIEKQSTISSESYLEVLAAGQTQSHDSLDDVEIIRPQERSR